MIDDYFKRDFYRYYRKDMNIATFLKCFLVSKNMRYIYSGRKSALSESRPSRFFWGGINRIIGRSMGNDIGFEHIGKGIVLTHPYGITINSGTVIGENVTLYKGCTCGSIRGGEKAGAPILGDRVVICANAMVCGNVKIGNDVLICAGAFVNFDVPDNSIVIGNPGVIHHKENASAEYL